MTNEGDIAVSPTANSDVKLAESSPAVDVTANSSAPVENQPPPRASTGAAEAETTPRTLHDAIVEAVSPLPANTETAKPAANGPDSAAKEVADEQLPFHKHPRWQEVLSERKRYQEEANRYKPMAEEYQRFV
ncbi:MAG: hypothetical protein ACRCUB_11060, partial [Plesiomonas shigelloides]